MNIEMAFGMQNVISPHVEYNKVVSQIGATYPLWDDCIG
jgi:hypothetical protein